VACFIHEDPIGFEAQWSAELRDAGGMVPSAVVDELDQVSRIYDNLALEIRGKAVLVSTSVALPVAEWPGFYNQARRIDNSLRGEGPSAPDDEASGAGNFSLAAKLGSPGELISSPFPDAFPLERQRQN